MFKWLGKLIGRAGKHVFRFVANPLGTNWKFRIRYMTLTSCWIIELDEGGVDGWRPLAHRVEAANNVLVEKPFTSYYEARQYASNMGLDIAYAEFFANQDRPEIRTFTPHPMLLGPTLDLPAVETGDIAEAVSTPNVRPMTRHSH